MRRDATGRDTVTPRCSGRAGYPAGVTRPLTAALSVALLAACARSAPDETARYVDALALGADGLADCQVLRDPTLRADCVSWASRALAQRGEVDTALQACATLEAGSALRGECVFLIADAVAARGEQAREICALAAPYDTRCLEHAVRRQLATVVGSMVRGEEAATEAAAEAEAAEWLGATRGRRFARHAVAKALAARPDELFSRSTCGTVSAVVCSRAFELRIDRVVGEESRNGVHPKETLDPVCPPPVSSEAAGSVGLPTWSPDVAQEVADAWRRACAKARSVNAHSPPPAPL